MGDRSGDDPSLSRRIAELERERDELRKDIEQICSQQAGPGFLGIATRIYLQRTAGFEQEIDNLKKKLVLCSRDNQNLQEELSEAYRIKGQLSDLCSAEVSKNMELEKQVKFFQGCIAAAFAERDQSLIESEEAKEQKEAISQELVDSHYRIEELESTCTNLWKDNTALVTELLTVKERILPLEKVMSKFYAIRQAAIGCPGCENWEDKCSCLLDDPTEMWIFDEDRNSSTSKYIASLEAELDNMRKLMDNLHNKIQMGMEIEHHLKRKVQSLEKKLTASDNILMKGLSDLRNLYSQKKIEVMSMLEDESTQIEATLAKVHYTLQQYNSRTELKVGYVQTDPFCDAECRDLHVTDDIDSSAGTKVISLARTADERFDSSDALAVALEEKVAALLLLSQQEERHLLERDVNMALQKKIEELQKNLFQVTHEKVTALMELASVKRQLQVQQENCTCGLKHCNNFADVGNEDVSQLHDSKLKDFFKRTYLSRWVGRDFARNESIASPNNNVVIPANILDSPVDLARLKVESATLHESISNMEHLTSSIQTLHSSLLKVRKSATSRGFTEGITETLDKIILEANNVKMALGSSLPISWSAMASYGAKNIKDNAKQGDSSEGSQSEKLDHVSMVGLEMVELLLLAAELQKELVRNSCLDANR